MTAGPTCPACHIAVLPGYTKCPKCHTLMPYSKGTRSNTVADPGGTVAAQKANLVVPVGVAVGVAGVIIAFFALRGHGNASAEVPRDAPTVAEAAQPKPIAPTGAAPPAISSRPLVPREASRPSPVTVAGDLERQLRKLRLWSTVEATGNRVDVRSASCEDPAMASVLDAATAPLRSAGLTKLRCLEESGRVVFERDF